MDIMKTQYYHANTIQDYLCQHQIATVTELHLLLGSSCVRTVFRKLSDLEYLSSYSHRGKYYTLPSVAAFDHEGLWCYKDVWFSCFGNLLDTARTFVERSSAGHTATELSDLLHVQSKHTLLDLVQRNQLVRERIKKTYVYFAANRAQHTQQRRERQSHRASMSILIDNPNLAVEEAKAAIMLFLGALDERQRRLYAGLESLKTGYGGDAYIAQLFGLDRHTVAKGRKELLSDASSVEGVRRSGGGRSSVEKKSPTSSHTSKI